MLQGVEIAAGGVIANAVVHDLFDGRAAATMLSRLFLGHLGEEASAPLSAAVLARPVGLHFVERHGLAA